MKKIVALMGMLLLVGLESAFSQSQYWEPPQNIQFPNIGFNTPLGSYDPSVVTYTLESDYRPGNGYQNVVYRGADNSVFGFNINVVGGTDKHRIYFFGPDNAWGLTLSSSSYDVISDPRTVPYDIVLPIPWAPNLSVGVTVSGLLSVEAWWPRELIFPPGQDFYFLNPDGSLTLTGTGIPGTVVENININDATDGYGFDAPVGADGRWQFTVPASYGGIEAGVGDIMTGCRADNHFRCYGPNDFYQYFKVRILPTALVTFDDLPILTAVPGRRPPREGWIPNGYAGLNWNNFRFRDTRFVLAPPPPLGTEVPEGYDNGWYDRGFQNGLVTPNVVAYGDNGWPSWLSSDVPFDFNRVFLAAAWHDGLTVQITAYDSGGEVMHEEFVEVDTAGPEMFTFDWLGVSSVQFQTSGGVLAPIGAGTFGDPGRVFLMENLWINEDLTPPEITGCAPNQVITAGGDCRAVVPDLTGLVSATDESGPVVITQQPAAGTTVGIGVTEVHFEVADSSCNTAMCTAMIEVIPGAAPVLQGVPADATVECDDIIPPPAAVTAVDGCGNPLTVQFMEAASGQTITRTWSAQDAGGQQVEASQVIQITDTTPPTLACPESIVLPWIPLRWLRVNYALPVATDNCDPNPVVVCSPPSGSAFPVGITRVVCTAVDASGNRSQCSFYVVRPFAPCPIWRKWILWLLSCWRNLPG